MTPFSSLSGRPAPMSADPLSDVLSLIGLRTVFSARLQAGGAWSLSYPSFEGIKFLAVVAGACWFQLPGQPGRRLNEGECMLLSRGASYRLASDLSLLEGDAPDIYSQARDGVARIGDGRDVTLLEGHFDFDNTHPSLLLDVLPPLIFLPSSSGSTSVIRWVLDRICSELEVARAGACLMQDHLAHLLLLQILRSELETQDSGTVGWFAALGDPKIGPAIRRIHKEPAIRWSLSNLAADAGMSRSSFADNFKRLVGRAPLDYVQALRMQLAARALRYDRRSVSAIGASLGYDSDSVFSHAFKRVMGVSPRQYRVGAD